MKKLVLFGFCILFLFTLSVVTYSATLILQDADSENTDDTMVKEQTPDGTSGTGLYMSIWGDSTGGNVRRLYLRFNLSLIERYKMSYIADAILQLTANIGTIDFATNSTVVYSNVTWSEETATWNNQPCGINLDNVGACNIGGFVSNFSGVENVLKFNVTNFVNDSLKYNKKNISFIVKHYNELVDESQQMSTKEDSDLVQRPALNITYVTNYPFVSLNLPNNNDVSNSSVTFNCSAISETSVLTNISLVANFSGVWEINQTKNLTGLDIENSTVFTKTLSDGTYVWNCEANNANGMSDFSFSNYTLTVETTSPMYSNWQNNASPTETKYNSTVNFSIDLFNKELDYYIFAHNLSETLTNETPVNISGSSYFANVTITVNLTRNNYICGQFWFNDTSGNINQTNLSCFTVAKTDPIISNIVTNSPQGYGYNISINATVVDIDGGGLDNVTIQIVFPNTTLINYTMTNVSSLYSYIFNDTWQNGIHNFTIFANNSLGDVSSTLSDFNISAVGVISIQTINSTYGFVKQVNLTDPPSALGLFNEHSKLISYKTYVIEFNEPSQFNYEVTIDENVKKSVLMKSLSWVFGETVNKVYKKSLVESHNKKISENQNEILEILNKKPIAVYKYTMNGMAIILSDEEYNKIKDSKNIKKIHIENYYNVTILGSVPAIRANQVWAKQNATGSNITGEDIRIAVLDTGIDYTHGFFGNCTLTNLTDGTCSKVEYGYDFYNDDNDPFDDMGHGTHVSGIIGGVYGNYKGVAPNVTLLEYKVCSSSGGCPESAIISAIENATLMGVDIISMSLGASLYVDEETLDTSLKSAWDSGILIVASSGNSADDYLQADDTIECPSCLDFVISVGAYRDDTDTITYFSSRGYSWNSNITPESIKPDLLAPGWIIASSVPTGSCILCDPSGIMLLGGTSMSAPHVSGVLALVKQAHPSWTKEELKSSVINTGVDIGYNVRQQGSGRTDALNAYNATIVVTPTSYLFINDNLSIVIYNNSYAFNITSKVDYNMSYNISFAGDSDITTMFNVTSINLTGYNSTSIMLNVTINNTKSNFSFYNGKIVVVSSTHTFYIPISIYTVLNPVNCPSIGTVYESSTKLSGGTCYMPDIIGGNKLEINTSDVELDCNGTTFDYIYQRRGGYGIYVGELAKNVTITNCSLEYVSVCIYAAESENITIKNSVFKHSEDFILSSGKRANITNNEFISTTGSGIQIAGNYSSITYNLFNDSGYGIRLPGNRYLDTGHIDIKHNQFYITHWTIDAYGVRDINISYNNFTNCFALGWTFSSADVYIENNRIIYDPNYPCGEVQGEDRCDYFGITGIVSWAFAGIPYPITNRIISRRNFINVTKKGISHITANNTIHEDTIIITQTEDVYLSDTDTIFINTTYNRSSVTFVGNSSITAEWWVELNVTNSTDNPVSGANVSSYINSSGVWELVSTKITDDNGYAKIAVEQYVHNSSGITYYNSKIEVNKTGLYGNISTYTNLSNNLNINITLLSGAPITPIISVVSPTNNSIVTSTWLMMNITINTDSDSAVYSLNETSNVSMDKQDATHFYKNITGLADNNTYNITFYANSTTSIWGVSDTYYFTINTSYTEPSITKSMINNTGNQDFRGYLTLKVQRDNAGVWDDYKIVTNNQLINLSTTAPYALDTKWFADGAYTTNLTGTFRVVVELKNNDGDILTFDNGSYINSTYEFNVSDIGLPAINVVAPTHGSYIKYNYSILNYTVTDDYNTSLNCYYILDSNETASPNNPITNGTYDSINMTNLNESTHTIYVKCDDGTQNGSSGTNTFTTDFTLPVITNPKPVNESIIAGTSDEEFTMHPSDAFLDTDSCRLYWKYPESETYTEVIMNYISNNCTIDIDLSGIAESEGVYYYFEVNDTATNIGTLGNSIHPMTVTTSDTIAPLFSSNITNATLTTPKKDGVVQINITVTDNTDVDMVILATNQSGTLINVSNQTFAGTSDISITAVFNLTISVVKGLMQYQFWANDSSGNVNVSELFIVEIKNTAPTFDIPLVAQSVDTGNSLYYDINASDIDTDTITYWDNTTLFDINSTNGEINDTPTESEAGTYSILITIGDGTVNTTSTFDYTITDKTIPTITWVRQDELNYTDEVDPTYLFNISDISGVNWTSVIFFHGLNDTLNNNMNTSWRYPASTKQPDRLRADNRNESNTLIEQNAVKLYTDDIVSYGGHLYGACVKPVVYSSGSTWATFNMSFNYHHMMEYHIPIDSTELHKEDKTNQYVDIYKNHYAIIQLETFPVGKTNLTMHINLNIDDRNGTYPLLIYGCNNSINPYTVDYTTDSNCAFYGTRTDFDTKDRVSRNSSYIHVHSGIDSTGKVSGTDLIPSDTMFMYLTSSAPNVANAYKLYYANNTIADNTNFNDTYYLHTYSPVSWTNRSETPDVQFEVSADNYQVQYYVYACDNVSNCVNSTIQLDSLGARANEAPTAPNLIQPLKDYNISGNYNITWTDGLDPDCDYFNITLILINYTDNSEIVLTNTVSNGTEYYQLDTTIYTDLSTYQIIIYANDSGGLNSDNDTSKGNFTIDNTNPLIDFDTGTLANNSYRNQTYIYINWTFTEANLENITAYLYNSTFDLINSTTFLTATYEINWTVTDLNELYYYNVTIYDYATNYNETETRVITLDNTNPSISSVTISGITANDATVSFTTSEACNYSIIYGFATDSMPYSIRSNTFATSHSPTFNTLLTYNRMYYFNLTVWDNAGNSDTDVDNNFTTLDKPPTGTGSGSTGLPSEAEDEPEVIIVEPEIIYVETVDSTLIEKILAFLTLKERTGFGEEIGENMASKTSTFNSFIMEIRTLKEWKINKGTSVYITLTDLTGNKVDPEKISVMVRDGDGNIVDSADEVKKLNLGNYIAILKVDEENELGSYFVEITTVYNGEQGSDVLAVEVEESEIGILMKIWKFIQRIWEALSKFKIIAPEDTEIDETIPINETNSTV